VRRVTALTYTVLLRDMVKRGAHGIAALLIALMIANASSIHLHARPHLFTILFFVFAHYLIARDRERPSKQIWWLVPLTVVWANVHSGFPVLAAVARPAGRRPVDRVRLVRLAPLFDPHRSMRSRNADQSQRNRAVSPHGPLPREHMADAEHQ
jgi:hypothetical protein